MLCDCPGLVFPSFMATKAEMYCNGLLRIDEMRDPMGPVSIICRRIARDVLERTYGFILPIDPNDPTRPPTPEELLTAYAYVRGYVTTQGRPDIHNSARKILKQFVDVPFSFTY